LKIEFKPQFFDDLDEIAEYVSAHFDENLARQIPKRIYKGCFILKDHPFLGREYSRNRYFRFLIVEKINLVFYHVDDDVVTVHRIFDSRKDYITAVNSIPEAD
jgi:addiction module RelE/StbE family toxin